MHRHRFDTVSFVFGALFVLLALAIGLPADPWGAFYGDWSLGWLWPAAIIVAGLLLLAPVLRRDRSPVPVAPPLEEEVSGETLGVEDIHETHRRALEELDTQVPDPDLD